MTAISGENADLRAALDRVKDDNKHRAGPLMVSVDDWNIIVGAALSTHQQQGADAWIETISVNEALKRADELRMRAFTRHEKLLAGGAHLGYAENALSIPIVHPGNPHIFRAPQSNTVTEALREADGCFEAALCEGWLEALADGDIERIRDLWERRLSNARNLFPAALAARGKANT